MNRACRFSFSAASERDATLSMDLLLQGLSLVDPHVRSPLKWPILSKLSDMETGTPVCMGHSAKVPVVALFGPYRVWVYQVVPLNL
jgi:hypothetical protein